MLETTTHCESFVLFNRTASPCAAKQMYPAAAETLAPLRIVSPAPAMILMSLALALAIASISHWREPVLDAAVVSVGKVTSRRAVIPSLVICPPQMSKLGEIFASPVE